ncbi:MAG: ShlB/FhaC/HecB family hemolysin secretion/activation protein [Coleofasciculus sp. C3-bin4]|nr:ShlB/FhaC/HecB family hemolysin secretion/activation protein [Coleofasciculus sp. C3-bin4]
MGGLGQLYLSSIGSDITPTPQPLPDNIPNTITVQKSEVLGSTAFNPSELAAVTAPFTEPPISSSETLQAQSPPRLNPVEPKPPELPEPQLLPPPTQFLQPPAPPPTTAPQPLPDNIPGTITVERFEIIGSTIFSSEELAAVTVPFTNRPITFAELLQVQDAIAQFYIKQGYVTTGAFIPPQSLKNGVVTIEVIEGEVEKIEVTGTRRLNQNYVRSRLTRATQTPLQVNRLVEALQLLQLNPLIEKLETELAAGSQTGTSVLRVKVVEAPSFSTVFRVDNGRSPSVGTVRRQVAINEANLFGFGDSLALAYSNTDGSNSLDEASYTIPLNARNGTLRFSYSRSSNHVIEEPFDQVDIESNARDYEITYRQPFIETPTQEFALGLSAVRRESDTSVLGEGYPLSPGANERGETRISAIRFFQEWINRGSREVLALRSQFSLGIDALDATINEKPPDSRFFAWRGQAQYLRLLAPDTILLLRSDIQLADQALVPIEQFGLGGIDSVRGYRQDALLSDNGLFASAELRVPIVRIPKWNSILQVAPFIEVGTTWNSSGRANPDPNTLASAGLGLLWKTGDQFTARLDWGIPFIDLGLSKDTLQEKGLYFTLEYKLF